MFLYKIMISRHAPTNKEFVITALWEKDVEGKTHRDNGRASSQFSEWVQSDEDNGDQVLSLIFRSLSLHILPIIRTQAP